MMSTNSTQDVVGGRARSRAKKACKSCNFRRVRCNVMEEQPCKNCRAADIPCELRKSRRGKYDRHAHDHRGSHAHIYQQQMNEEEAERNAVDPSLGSTTSEKDSGQDDVGHYGVQEGMHLDRGGGNTRSDETLAGNSYHNPPSSTTSPNSNSAPTMNGADSTVFLGESSSISLVHAPQTPSIANHSSPADKTRLRYPIPDGVNVITSLTPFEQRRKLARIEFLRQEGAFSYPSPTICETVLLQYFSWFHPCFPILDRRTFYESYLKKTVSPLLFQAVMFVGATHCNEKIMRELGYSTRQDARNEMFNHAKDIYDADYEMDKIIVSQALFLMSFRRAGPLLEKDTRHWLGAAISLAQTKGMHRSSATSSFADGRLRKRIWWSLYVRDRQCSAALGLPTRIRDEDCDIEMLEMSDFEEKDHAPYPKYLGVQKKEHILYAIQIAKLAMHLGKIVLREFAPIDLPKEDLERSKLRDDLMIWESELSSEMRSGATAESFWASMLHLSYNNLYILLYRAAYLTETDDQSVGNIALQAACRNTRIIEDVLSQDLVQHGTVHATTSLFNSLCIHTICLRRSQNTARKLAEYRAQLCLLGLRELQKTWDVTNWVLQLFLQFLDRSTAKRLEAAGGDNEEAASGGQKSGFVATPRAIDHDSDSGVEFGGNGGNGGVGNGGGGGGIGGYSDIGVGQGLDFASHLFGTKEAEDFSMFQLQPDLFSGDAFGGGLEQYYHSMLPRGEGGGMEDVSYR